MPHPNSVKKNKPVRHINVANPEALRKYNEDRIKAEQMLSIRPNRIFTEFIN